LERELKDAKARAEEYAQELERCREAKRQLERELINGPPSNMVPVAADAASQLADAYAARIKLEGEVKELKDKLCFYVEGQQKMEEDHMENVRLGEEIRRLCQENGELRRRPGAKEANRRCAIL